MGRLSLRSAPLHFSCYLVCDFFSGSLTFWALLNRVGIELLEDFLVSDFQKVGHGQSDVFQIFPVSPFF
jgi:hypothetical protein